MIIDVSSHESGTQFDRFGGIWINDQEVLRTTTPEPTADGIVWTIEKDITIYGQYLQSLATSNANLTAYLSIPNNVDSTYTGIIYLDASVTFFLGDDADFPAEKNLPYLHPLTKAPQDGVFPPMTLSGDANLTYTFHLPNKNSGSSYGTTAWSGLVADIYASGHGCEEFYYSNLPSNNASNYGLCGGGIYREIQVVIDEKYLAGAILPFAVIYTGGVNPFLWRPLTGIMSFDIPSHRLDLTPFLGYLADGKNHTITFKVYGNNVEGFWYVDASLLFIHGSGGNQKEGFELGENVQLIGGSIANYYDSGVLLTETSSIYPIPHHGNISFDTNASHAYQITGSLIYSNGQKLIRTVSGRQVSANTNQFIGDSLTVTKQNSTCEIYSGLILPDGSRYSNTIYSNYPLYLENYYAQDDTTFDMQATVGYAYTRAQRLTYLPPSASHSSQESNSNNGWVYEVDWSNKMYSNATYNRTLDHTTVYVESDTAAETYLIASSLNAQSPLKFGTSLIDLGPKEKVELPLSYTDFVSSLKGDSPVSTEGKVCFSRDLQAQDGSVLRDSMNGKCDFPTGVSFCGFDLCGFYDFIPIQQAKLSTTTSVYPTIKEKGSLLNDKPDEKKKLVSGVSSAEVTVRMPNKKLTK